MNSQIMKGESDPKKEHFRLEVMERIFTTLSCNEKGKRFVAANAPDEDAHTG